MNHTDYFEKIFTSVSRYQNFNGRKPDEIQVSKDIRDYLMTVATVKRGSDSQDDYIFGIPLVVREDFPPYTFELKEVE